MIIKDENEKLILLVLLKYRISFKNYLGNMI